MPRKRTEPLSEEEKTYRSARKAFRTKTSRHVFRMEADVNQEDAVQLAGLCERVRLAINELVAIMQNRIDQMYRRRDYRGVLSAWEKVPASDDKERARLRDEFKRIQEECGVTAADCASAMVPIAKWYRIPSVFGLTSAEDVWCGVEDVLYGRGRRLHFRKRGDLPSLRAKQPDKIIVIKMRDGNLTFTADGLTFGFRKPREEWDRFESDEIAGVCSYLANAEEIDRDAVSFWKESGWAVDTFRPCFATLVCEEIRGKLRVFIHITIEGRASVKFNREGEIRHQPGKGRVGADIGAQTAGWTSDTETGIDNLAVRGPGALEIEEKIARINQQMDRSRRATNPDNYNPDGTIRKGPKKWKYSKRYRKLRRKRKELMRKARINRHLAINEMVNHFRTLGDEFITEPKNAARMAKRAKMTTYNKHGRPNRKKRFGKSISRRCPGYLQTKAEQVFTGTGGSYHEVPYSYRASQYDHTSNTYYKKPLSARRYHLQSGVVVGRDWYSSFLLYNTCSDFKTIDRQRCLSTFAQAKAMQDAVEDRIRKEGKHVFNSGI